MTLPELAVSFIFSSGVEAFESSLVSASSFPILVGFWVEKLSSVIVAWELKSSISTISE
jgi:hypothetical protein